MLRPEGCLWAPFVPAVDRPLGNSVGANGWPGGRGDPRLGWKVPRGCPRSPSHLWLVAPPGRVSLRASPSLNYSAPSAPRHGVTPWVLAHPAAVQDSYLVDSASSHMLVSKIKPCMSKYKHSIL
jgi:hypothetical protein